MGRGLTELALCLIGIYQDPEEHFRRFKGQSYDDSEIEQGVSAYRTAEQHCGRWGCGGLSDETRKVLQQINISKRRVT